MKCYMYIDQGGSVAIDVCNCLGPMWGYSASLIASNPQAIMLNFLPIMFLSNAQIFAYYAQYYAHEYCNYATVCVWFYYF